MDARAEGSADAATTAAVAPSPFPRQAPAASPPLRNDDEPAPQRGVVEAQVAGGGELGAAGAGALAPPAEPLGNGAAHREADAERDEPGMRETAAPHALAVHVEGGRRNVV